MAQAVIEELLARGACLAIYPLHDDDELQTIQDRWLKPLCNAEITRRTAKEDGQLARLARAFERVRGAFAARPAGAPPFRGRLPRCFGRDSDSDEAASEDDRSSPGSVTNEPQVSHDSWVRYGV